MLYLGIFMLYIGIGMALMNRVIVLVNKRFIDEFNENVDIYDNAFSLYKLVKAYLNITLLWPIHFIKKNKVYSRAYINR